MRENFNADDVDNDIWTLCLISPLRPVKYELTGCREMRVSDTYALNEHPNYPDTNYPELAVIVPTYAIIDSCLAQLFDPTKEINKITG